MGLFDFLKKKNNEDYKEFNSADEHYSISVCRLEDGVIKVNFITNKAEEIFRQQYDSMELLIMGDSSAIEDKSVKDCKVSWYGMDDAIEIDEHGRELSRRTRYKHVLAEIDTDLIETDNEYGIMVMNGLLRKNRVERYLRDGLNENPETPCGEYVGGVRRIGNEYKKVFDIKVGEKAHNLDTMKEKREKWKIKQEQTKQNLIEIKKERIRQLQEEIDELSR